LALLLLSLRALAVTGVPVRSASPAAVEAALDLLALRDGERFADLGCGHGNVLARARARADVLAEGFELNPSIALLAALRHLRDPRVHIHARDSRRADLSRFTALYAYLLVSPMAELAPVLARLPAGTRIASVDYELPGWTPAETREVGLHRVLLYVVQ
jgi:hypothetical protein